MTEAEKIVEAWDFDKSAWVAVGTVGMLALMDRIAAALQRARREERERCAKAVEYGARLPVREAEERNEQYVLGHCDATADAVEAIRMLGDS